MVLPLPVIVLFLSACFAMSAVPAHAGEPGVTVLVTDLRERPFLDARSLTQLAAQSRLEVLDRQGGWMRVKAAGREGWVRLLAVRLDAPSSESGAGSWMTRFGFFPGRTRSNGSVSATVTTGIRGLSPVELANAEPDPEQVQRLQTFRATPEQAQGHAVAAALSTFPVLVFDEHGKPVKGQP